ncbi:MAG: gamma-glutamyltransferase [Pirellula sp.]
MNTKTNRRKFLYCSGASVAAATFSVREISASTHPNGIGTVVGQAAGEKVGSQVLESGGNATDAVVAAALTAAIAAPSSTGIGGYGMAAVIAYDGGRRIIAIDGNSTAPKSTPKDLLQLNSARKAPDGLNAKDSTLSVGWLTAGVPGVLAGLQLMLNKFGTRGFDELVQPAIVLARNGIVWPKSLAAAIRKNAILQNDPGSKKLYFPNGDAVAEGSLFKNPDLADMLTQLAKANSVDAFYQGDIAQSIAEGFRKNGGLVTAQDMADYRARVVEPLKMELAGHTLYTAPLTAGGMSVLQMLRTLDALKWNSMTNPNERLHARVEAMRIAWRDRLGLLGDPDFGNVPTSKLLSNEYAQESATQIKKAVRDRTLSSHRVRSRNHTGTIHLSAADKHGNFVALTLTHGNGFGACVTVDGLGLTLGHGLSRFDPNPSHPNGPEPGKRPLHNMIPTIVTRSGSPVLAVGGTGGRKIPNALFDVLTQYLYEKQPIAASMAYPRLNTDGSSNIATEKSYSVTDVEYLKNVGYTVRTEAGANMHAVALENGSYVRASR